MLNLLTLRPILAGMAEPPTEPPKLKSWTIYKIAGKAIWLGTVEAGDKAAEGRSGIQNRGVASVRGAAAMSPRKGKIIQTRFRGKWPHQVALPVGKVNEELLVRGHGLSRGYLPVSASAGLQQQSARW